MSQQIRRFGALSSSENPNELASRVKGVIIAVSVIIIWAVGYIFHITLTPNDVVSFATDIGAVVASIVFVYGWCKASVIWLIDKWNNRNVID